MSFSEADILKSMNAYRVHGSALNTEVRDIARMLHLPQANVEVFISRSKAINARMMTCNEGLRVVITEPLLHALGSTPHGAVSQETRAVIGHELGHIAEGNLKPYLLGGILPVVLLPLIAVEARRYVAHLHQHQIHPAQALNYLHTRADQEHPPQSNEYPKLDSMVARAAKDVAAATLGLGAGAFIAATNSKWLEFRCDTWGARASSPEAMISSFKKMEQAFAQRRLHGIRVPDADPFRYGEAKGMVTQWFIRFMQTVIGAHPDPAARIGKLERLIPEMALTVAHCVR